MFNSITGTVTGKKGNTCFIENSGIEWALNCSQRSLDQLPKKGEKARVLTYLHHKEDTMLLFGFASEDERSLFLELIRISGIGPKQGIKILSGISAEAFINALENDDIAGISSLPGIGKKTAQKIILSLRGKLVKEDTELNVPYIEIADSLSDMGFDRKKALKVVKELFENSDIQQLSETDREKEIFRRAIVTLSS